MSKGFMVIDRERLSDWQWLTDKNVYYAFTRMLFDANFEKKLWRNIVIERGQFVCGIDRYAAELGFSTQSLRTIIQKLKKSGDIDVKATNKFTIITICNYDSWCCKTYNEEDASNEQTNNQATNNQQTTNDNLIIELNKRIEQLEKEKEELANASLKKTKSFVPPTVEEVSGYVREQGFHFDAVAFVSFYESKGWFVGKNKMKDWKAACRTWERKRKENVSTPQSREEIGVILRGNNTGKYDNAELWD